MEERHLLEAVFGSFNPLRLRMKLAESGLPKGGNVGFELMENQKLGVSERSTLGARYSPTNYRVITAAYRRQRTASEQIDVGWQWPMRDFTWGTDDEDGRNLTPGQGLGPGRWYSVGRMNYSLKDQKLVDSIFGFEFDAGCWLGRVVFERLQSTLSTSNTRLFFQLEFVGLARVGSSPLQSLRNNITNYQFLRDHTEQPSRFQSYE